MAEPPCRERQVVPESGPTARNSVQGGRAGALPASVFEAQHFTATACPASSGRSFPTQPWDRLHEPVVPQGFSTDWSQLPRDLRPSELRDLQPSGGQGFGDQLSRGEAMFAELPLLELSRPEPEHLSNTDEGQLALEIQLLERQLEAELAWASAAQGSRQILPQSSLLLAEPDVWGPSHQAMPAWNGPLHPSQPSQEPVVPQGIWPQVPLQRPVHNDETHHRPGAGRVLVEQLDHDRQRPDSRSQMAQLDLYRQRPDSRSQTAFSQFSRSEFRHFKQSQQSSVLTIQGKIHTFHAKKFISEVGIALIQSYCRQFLAKSYLAREEVKRWEAALRQVRSRAILQIRVKCKVLLARHMLWRLRAQAAARYIRGCFSSYLARKQLTPQFQIRRAARLIQAQCHTFLAQKSMLADAKKLVLASQIHAKVQAQQAKDYLLIMQAQQSARDVLHRRQQVRQSALEIQRACQVFLARQQLLQIQQGKVGRAARPVQPRGVFELDRGVPTRAIQQGKVGGAARPAQPRGFLEVDRGVPNRALEMSVQDAWEVVLKQQHEHARMDEEVSRLKRVQEQAVDSNAWSCMQCDHNMVVLDVYLRALKRINSAVTAGADRSSSSSSGMGNNRFLLAKTAAALTSVVNEIEEAGGKVEHQLKELAAYLSWVSVNSFAPPRTLQQSLQR